MVETQNVGTAFALVFAAAGTTAIGSSFVFFPRLVKLADRRTLAGALAMAAGVMMYVSMVDIYNKAIDGFVDEGHSDDEAFIYATFMFALGVGFMMFLNRVVIERMLGGADVTDDIPSDLHHHRSHSAAGNAKNETRPSLPTFSPNPAEDLNSIQQLADEEVMESSAGHNNAVDANNCNEAKGDAFAGVSDVERGTTASSDDSVDAVVSEHKRLMNMGLATALAIALHNFPEGLVTFVAYMDDPAVGIVLAIGIALHNIPEGVCVGMPIYYATGSRWQGFFWGVSSGVSEPLGALIGWAVLESSISGNANGILFGLVAGIMVFIAVDELLPTALRYDPSNKVTTYCFIIGMFIIAGSLVLFSV